MAFTPEDGTGLPNSNSYVSLAYADSFHTDRGNAAWTGVDAVKQGALVRATDFLEQQYAGCWNGEPLSDTQALSWPRDEAGIPDKIKQAVCVLALETISGASLNPTQGPTVKKEKVADIEVEYMDGNAGGKTGTRRPAIDQLLYGLISAASSINAKVIRV